MEVGASMPEVRGLGRWLSRIAPRAAHGAVTVAILPDARVKLLNRQFRAMNKPTDVLSFPGEQRSDDVFVAAPRGRREAPFLGEIVISRGIARKQAKSLGHSVKIEIRVLALHGLLHLLGYDHEVDAGQMARIEARLRRKAGLPLGLIARAS